MNAADSAWRRSVSFYRAMIFGQTLAGAIGTVFIRFVLRHPGGLLGTGFPSLRG